MSEIIVAGAGHAGLVAAMKIASAGHSVTIFERNTREECGLDQWDYFAESAMEYAGIDFPDSYRAENNRITFVPLDDDAPSLTMPENKTGRTLKIYRKEFLNRLISLCINAGVKFVFETKVVSPVVLGSRVVGIETDKGRFYADLIIDSCGVDSPLRKSLPEFTMIENEYKQFDVLHTYRATYENIKENPQPDNKYNVILKDDGTEGMTWAVTEDSEVDILIARFNSFSNDDFEKSMKMIRSLYPHVGERLCSGGEVTTIPVRQPLAVLVADGFAAVGDSAFMTYAVKGSGIAYSIIAGTILAETVINDSECLFNCDTLWDFQKRFFKEIGFDACRIAIMKNCLPYLTAQEVSDMFKNGLITSEGLEYFANIDFQTAIKTKIIQLIKVKIKVLNDNPEFKTKMLGIVVWLGRFSVIEPFLPNKYNREDVKKWATKYNEFFDSIRKPISNQA